MLNAVLVYSTHGYTTAVTNRLKKMGLECWEAASESELLAFLENKAIGLVILDSSEEEAIVGLIRKLADVENNRHASVLFLVPGAIRYEEELLASDRSILGISKPFSVKQFENTVRFLLEKKKQQDKVISSLKDLQQFTAMASHDLKTPIKNVFAFAEIALEDSAKAGDSVPAEIIESIEIIRDESKRMIAFVNDMFAFSSAGSAKLKLETIDLEASARDTYAMVAKDFEGREAHLTLQDLPTALRGDQVKLVHILQNLIENAFKYSNPEVALQLTIRSSQLGAHSHTFSVEDNGLGIRPQDIPKIFLPFKRGLTRTQGTGIGLAIVKKFVEAHHGEIWVESTLGQGSKFFFTCAELGDGPYAEAS